MAKRRVLAGTSGFSYLAWRGHFYPDDLSPKEMLSFYAGTLDTVEINYTFHRLPTPALLTGWSRQTPPRFRFALKAPQRVTHQLRLRDTGEPLGRFHEAAVRLGAKLGPILFQLPPYLRFDAPRLADFLASLPAGLEPTIEFRNDSWFNDTTYAILSEHRTALCIADAETLTTPWVPTAPFGYLRLRRTDYDDAALDRWAAQVADAESWKRTYVYFKHEDAGRGPKLAQAFLARM